MVSEGLSAENVIDVDHDVCGIAKCIMEDDILEKFETHQEESDQDNNDCNN